MAEITQVSDRSDELEARRDHTPELIAVGSFVAVVALIAGLIFVPLDLPEAVTRATPWFVAISIGLYFRFAAPSSRLTPARRVQRHERRAGAVVGVLSAVTVVAAIAEALNLNSWDQWAVLAGVVSLAVGGILALRVHFTIGS